MQIIYLGEWRYYRNSLLCQSLRDDNFQELLQEKEGQVEGFHQNHYGINITQINQQLPFVLLFSVEQKTGEFHSEADVFMCPNFNCSST